MNVLRTLSQRLSWKLFFSYLIIILVGVVVLAGTAQFRSTAAIGRHVESMRVVLGDDPTLAADLEANFRSAVSEILTNATVAAFLAAVAVSLFTARRIVNPIRAMTQASQRIAAGDYHQRVQVLSQDELGSMAQAFNQMAETLEQTEQRRLALIGDVAHELRTPLSSIRGVMEGLVDGVLPAEPATYVGVQKEVARLQRLVHDLEELSRAEAGQTSIHLCPTDLSDVVSAAAERLRPQFDDKQVDLDLELPSHPIMVSADINRVTQVLLNLLGNALHYTPAGGRVQVRTWQSAQEAFIAVEDDGIGISPEHLAHVFERFYRVDKSRSRTGGGSGIGLTIAKHLVEAHGGRIWAASPGAGQGSTFTVTLRLSR
jgi:signal transduction histidine kinase